jgi:hypothetical protein
MRDAFAEYRRSRRSGGPTTLVPPAEKRAVAIRRRVLVGVAAAGVSRPAPLTPGGERVPEVIAQSAWKGVQADIASGVTFDFRIGHDGKPWLRSNDHRVRLTFDPVAGLLFEISADAAEAFKWPANAVASIGFKPIEVGKRFLRGEWVREIRSMKLQHVAIEKPHKAIPYYDAARVLSVPPEQASRSMFALRVDARIAAREAGL